MTESQVSPYPRPPENFNQRSLPIERVEAGRYFYRLNSRRNEDGEIYSSARFFDRTGSGRWDGGQQGYGILYVGDDFYATYIECYGRELGRSLITDTELDRRFLARFTSTRLLKFVKVFAEGLSQLGVDAGISSCPPREYEFSREWGRAFYQHPDNVDGICYMSRHDDSRPCYGIFDRVTSEISEEQLCEGEFTSFTERSIPDRERSLLLARNRQHPKVDLDNVLEKYKHQLISDTQIRTAIDPNLIVD
jgi:RES domain